MKDKRFMLGIVLTVLWLTLAAYLAFTQNRPSELNAWGDFFAGFFAPLAFLWLVLGYLQQGEELRHSTEALKLQAEELRASVVQQSELVAVSREQMKQELRALEEERERRRDAARPKFVPQLSSTIRSGSEIEFKLKVVNVGNTATKLRMQFAPPLGQLSHHNLALVPNGEIMNLSFKKTEDVTSIATLNYIDADGLPGSATFTLEVIDTTLRIGDIQRLA
ncbi:MAG TPA: hypothetical protein VEC06_02005 [Paucimonas sp.]|nr:hypothetical protein [Paucimonas sp.]